jgi:hypothetical protein
MKKTLLDCPHPHGTSHEVEIFCATGEEPHHMLAIENNNSLPKIPSTILKPNFEILFKCGSKILEMP